jgi:hypothetical protein
MVTIWVYCCHVNIVAQIVIPKKLHSQMLNRNISFALLLLTSCFSCAEACFPIHTKTSDPESRINTSLVSSASSGITPSASFFIVSLEDRSVKRKSTLGFSNSHEASSGSAGAMGPRPPSKSKKFFECSSSSPSCRVMTSGFPPRSSSRARHRVAA